MITDNKTFARWQTNQRPSEAQLCMLKHWLRDCPPLNIVHMYIWRGTLHSVPIINIQFNRQQNTDGLMVL